MGTSTNQPSSRRDPSWIAARVALANQAFPVVRQSQEIWRAADADAEAALKDSISHSLFAKAATLARTAKSAAGAMSEFDNYLDKSATASVFTEIGKRALARAVQTGQGANGFAAELFAETASYYVSRDLPSLMGLKGRVSSVKEATELKTSVCGVARTAAAQIATNDLAFSPSSVNVNQKAWKAYVSNVVSALQGKS